MKPTLVPLLTLLSFAVPAQAAVIFGGDFQLYKPGEPTVTAELTGGGFVPWNGLVPPTNLSVAGGGSADYSDGTSGATVDLLGWTKVQGNIDLVENGPGGSVALNAYGSWGGQSRVVSLPLGTIAGGLDYTISAMIGGPDSGPIQGPFAFHLLANGVELTPTSLVDPNLPNGGNFQSISRTYEAADLAGFVGQEMTILVGVADGNAIGNRVIFDDISLVPEPSTPLLMGLGGFALVFFRSRKK